MVEVSAEDITNVAPEFADVDEDIIEFYIESARDYVNEGRWGKKSKRGIMFMAMHLMSRGGLLPGEDSSGGMGAVLSESVGGVSVTYASPASSTDEGSLGLTSYGESFIMLKKTIMRGPLVV